MKFEIPNGAAPTVLGPNDETVRWGILNGNYPGQVLSVGADAYIPAFSQYKATGVNTFYGGRQITAGTAGGLSQIEWHMAPGAAYGAHTWTKRMSLDENGLLTLSANGATNNTVHGVTSGYAVLSFNADIAFATACGIAAKGSGGDEKLYALVPDTTGTGFYYKVGNTTRFTVDRYGCVSLSIGATTSAMTDLLINPTTKSGAGNFIDAQINGTSKFSVNYNSDAYFARWAQLSPGTTALKVVSDGGVKIRNWNDNADAALTAGAGTFNGEIKSIGSSGGFKVTNRSDNTDTWNIYSDTSALKFYSNTTSGDKFTIDNAGAISIGNTVNTVSPTSPNRTVTIVINGTTYYLAAKTTND